MKIVHVEDFIHPNAGYQINMLGRLQAQQGHQVDIVAGDDDAFYALFVERGHRINSGKAVSGNTKAREGTGTTLNGMVPPHPFMKPALTENAQLCVDFIMTGIADRLPEMIDWKP